MALESRGSPTPCRDTPGLFTEHVDVVLNNILKLFIVDPGPHSPDNESFPGSIIGSMLSRTILPRCRLNPFPHWTSWWEIGRFQRRNLKRVQRVGMPAQRQSKLLLWM